MSVPPPNLPPATAHRTSADAVTVTHSVALLVASCACAGSGSFYSASGTLNGAAAGLAGSTAQHSTHAQRLPQRQCPLVIWLWPCEHHAPPESLPHLMLYTSTLTQACTHILYTHARTHAHTRTHTCTHTTEPALLRLLATALGDDSSSSSSRSITGDASVDQSRSQQQPQQQLQLLGWFSSRSGEPCQPSMREAAVTVALQAWAEAQQSAPAPAAAPTMLFGLITASAAHSGATLSLQHAFHACTRCCNSGGTVGRPQQQLQEVGPLAVLPLDIINLGQEPGSSTGGAAGALLPGTAAPVSSLQPGQGPHAHGASPQRLRLPLPALAAALSLPGRTGGVNNGTALPRALQVALGEAAAAASGGDAAVSAGVAAMTASSAPVLPLLEQTYYALLAQLAQAGDELAQRTPRLQSLRAHNEQLRAALAAGDGEQTPAPAQQHAIAWAS
jgi:hypothetical protein